MQNIKTLKLEEIIKILKEHKEEIKQKYHVREIGLFGSYVRGEEKESSDIDILIDFVPHARVSLLDFIELEDYLSELLGVKVDLVDKQALKSRIAKHILSEVIIL
ncbi:nucleotidyltransferase family protein [Thermodesulfovibrio yellowstonii]|uniref:Nucleotidyltransferase n=1 Tax=Thermodesulfovibrio yellowstonii TaxID=28262 RepID=A0A9W6LKK3_9BACT|nr:nucleotidyltransferase family protein [Thermodesulfovibrio islandicus]GLI53358.1 nucleotidyltransferase [Thermodesulfovibrio islandicus]